MKRRQFVSGAAALGLGSVVPRRAPADDRIPLRVGTIPLDSVALALYARDLGYFDEAGLDVNVNVFTTGGSSMLAALLGNQLDICATSTAPLILARNRGIKVRYFYPGVIYQGGAPNSALMVAKNAPIRSGPDINGKTIAVAALQDLTQYAVQGWITAGGGKVESVRFIEIPYPAMLPALAQGRVDAICQPEPFLTEAKSLARVVANLDDVVGKPYYITGWMASDDWPQQNAEARNRFIKAMQRAARWANRHHPESGAILVKYSKMDPAVVTAMKRNFNDEASRVNPKFLENPLNAMIKYGGISPQLTVNDLVWLG